MRQTSTGKASLRSPGKGSSSNGDKKQKSGSASNQQQVLPESHGHDASVSCSQICVQDLCHEMLLLAKLHVARQALQSVHVTLDVCQSCKQQSDCAAYKCRRRQQQRSQRLWTVLRK